MVSDRSVNLPAGREEAAIGTDQGHEAQVIVDTPPYHCA